MQLSSSLIKVKQVFMYTQETLYNSSDSFEDVLGFLKYFFYHLECDHLPTAVLFDHFMIFYQYAKVQILKYSCKGMVVPGFQVSRLFCFLYQSKNWQNVYFLKI